MSLVHVERPAAGDPEGLLVLHHGRGADEQDLLGLADVLDPHRRLHVASPRAPLTLEDWPGHHWYLVPQVGYPDPETFHAARAVLGAFHEEVWDRTGLTPEQTVLGGFSMGSVMSYTMAFDSDRPAVAGVLVFSGFVPTVDGWAPDFASRSATRAFVSHGRRDRVIHIQFARRALELMTAAGIEVDYHESDAAHHIDPAVTEPATGWLSGTVVARG